MKRGLTLVEMLVSLVILTIILTAVFSILNIQKVRATQVQKTTILQTDAQVALTLMRWDLGAAGLAYPKEQSAVRSFNNTGTSPTGTDAISMKAAGFGFESGVLRWSWLLERANSNQFLCRSWADTAYNFKLGDTIVTLDQDRTVMTPPGDLVVQAIDTATYTDPYGNPNPAQSITTDLPLNAIGGLVVIRKYSDMFDQAGPGLTISVSNNKLVRGSDTLLENVEDLQFAYGTDTDGDDVIDLWTNDLPQFTDRKWAIRYTLVITTRPIADYEYPMDSVTVEDHSYTLNLTQKRQKRAILTGIIAPPNLQP
jgi:prepilin-type N-terminal cleavage/methylation domain-containing protein